MSVKEKNENLLTFRLGEQTFGLPIAPIVQIVPLVAITPIPQVNHSVEGVINYKGVNVPAINLRRHLGLPEIALGLDTHIIMATVDDKMVGLVVDQVLDVAEFPSMRIASPEDVLPAGLGSTLLLQGLVHTLSGMMLLLDLDYLFSSQHVQALAETIAGEQKDAYVEDTGEPEPEIVG
jgi:purine-binding chemotaxis protein CheW